MPSRMIILLVVCLFSWPSASALAGAEFLGQEARRDVVLGDLVKGRPHTRHTGKVYTNDDVESARRPAAGSPSPAKGGENAAASAPEEAAGSGTEGAAGQTESQEEPLPKEKDPAYWRGRVAPLQEELARLEADIRRLRPQTGVLPQGQTRSGIDMMGGGGSFNPRQSLENLEKRKRAVESQLAAIAEEARRARVPPGWVR